MRTLLLSLSFLVGSATGFAQAATDRGPPTPPSSDEVRLDVVGSEPGLELHWVTGESSRVARTEGIIESPSFARICIAPCSVRVRRGEYQLAAGMFETSPQPVGRPVRIDVPSRIDLRLESNSAWRVAGVGALIGGGLGGLILTGYGIWGDVSDGRAIFIGTGLGTIVLTALVGLVLMGVEDGVDAQVSPLTL